MVGWEGVWKSLICQRCLLSERSPSAALNWCARYQGNVSLRVEQSVLPIESFDSQTESIAYKFEDKNYTKVVRSSLKPSSNNLDPAEPGRSFLSKTVKLLPQMSYQCLTSPFNTDRAPISVATIGISQTILHSFAAAYF